MTINSKPTKHMLAFPSSASGPSGPPSAASLASYASRTAFLVQLVQSVRAPTNFNLRQRYAMSMVLSDPHVTTFQWFERPVSPFCSVYRERVERRLSHFFWAYSAYPAGRRVPQQVSRRKSRSGSFLSVSFSRPGHEYMLRKYNKYSIYRG